MEIAHGQFQKNSVAWVDLRGNTVTVSRGMAASCELEDKVKRVERGEVFFFIHTVLNMTQKGQYYCSCNKRS